MLHNRLQFSGSFSIRQTSDPNTNRTKINASHILFPLVPYIICGSVWLTFVGSQKMLTIKIVAACCSSRDWPVQLKTWKGQQEVQRLKMTVFLRLTALRKCHCAACMLQNELLPARNTHVCQQIGRNSLRKYNIRARMPTRLVITSCLPSDYTCFGFHDDCPSFSCQYYKYYNRFIITNQLIL